MRIERWLSVLLIAIMFCVVASGAMAHLGLHEGELDHKNIDVDKEDYLTQSADIGDDTDKIRKIVSPLSGVPEIREPGQTLRVEVKSSENLHQSVEAWLVPSFGRARPKTYLNQTTQSSGNQSEIWPNRNNVNVLEFDVPNFQNDFKPDLYDLHVAWEDSNGEYHQDFQPRAVEVTNSFPDDPQVAVVADPQSGDPRGITKTFDQAKSNFSGVDCSDPDNAGDCVGAFVDTLEDLDDNWAKTLGNLSRENRWGSFQKAIEEINAMNPDFVVIPGDLAMGARYKIEYPDVYRLLNQFKVPTYVTPGNHDGITFHFNESDGGLNRWERTFAPRYYSKNLGANDQIHIVSMNSFDWPEDKRKRANIICDATAGGPEWWKPCEGFPAIGGYIRDPQVSWLDNDLSQWRSNHPETQDQMLLTFSHHDPSWQFGNHSWSSKQGNNRNDVRAKLMQYDADVHFAGHVHQDRVARYFDSTGNNQGDGVASVGQSGKKAYDVNDNNMPNVNVRSKLEDPTAGPLFVETTTTSSSTSQYWGWRMVKLDHQNTGIVPHNDPSDPSAPQGATKFGYLAPPSFVNSHPVSNSWDHQLADLGLYSYPSYHLNTHRSNSLTSNPQIEVENDLSEPVEGTLLQPLNACGQVNVTNGNVIWSRTQGGHQDVLIGHQVGAGNNVTIETDVQGNGICIIPVFNSIMQSSIHTFW